MKFEILRTAEGLGQWEPAWNDLVGDSDFQAPFHSWAWYDAWWRHFHEGRQPLVIAGYADDGRLQVVAPLMIGRRRLRGFPVREIGLMANSISPANEILFRRGVPAQAALEGVLGCLAAERRQWDLLRLWNLPAASACVPLVEPAAGRRGFRPLCEAGWQSAFVDVRGDFEQYMNENFSKDRRRGLRQKVRHLSTRPDYTLRDFRRPEEIDEALDLAFAVSRSSWKGPLGTDMGGCPHRAAFYRDISRRLAARGQVRIWISMLGETPLAVQYQLVAPDAIYLVISDFDQGFAGQSPGTVLLYQVLEQLFAERSVARFQFSGDLYDYKSKWATGLCPHATFELFGPGWYPRLLYWAKTRALPAVRAMRFRRPRGAGCQPAAVQAG